MADGAAVHGDISQKELEALELVQRIIEDPTMRRYLAKDYQRQFRADPDLQPHTGFCSIASDALRRMLGGTVKGFSGYRLCRIVHEGSSHYYLKTPRGQILDATAGQFQTPVPYKAGKGSSLQTRRIPGRDVQAPTLGARAIMERARADQPAPNVTGEDMADGSAAQWVPLDALRPWANNPRKDQPVASVAASIERFGFAAPIVARTGGEIIAGHTRYLAAQKLGLEKVPVRWMDLDAPEAHALALADNKMTELALWDEATLSDALRSIEAAGGDVADLGWDESELHLLLANFPFEPVEDDGRPLGEVSNLVCPECGAEHPSEAFKRA